MVALRLELLFRLREDDDLPCCREDLFVVELLVVAAAVAVPLPKKSVNSAAPPKSAGFACSKPAAAAGDAIAAKAALLDDDWCRLRDEDDDPAWPFCLENGKGSKSGKPKIAPGAGRPPIALVGDVVPGALACRLEVAPRAADVAAGIIV